MMTAATRVGRRNGKVTWRKRRQRPAPSIRAAWTVSSGQVLEGDEEDQGDERERLPDVDRGEHEQRSGDAAEEHRRLLDEPSVDEPLAEQAAARVEEPLEHRGNHDRRQGPRNQERGTSDPSAGESLVEDQGDGQAERDRR